MRIQFVQRMPRMRKPTIEILETLHAANWDDIIPRLVFFALQRLNTKIWLGKYCGNPPEGTDANDIVHNAIKKVLSGERMWNKSIPLIYFLMGIVRSDISNMARSFENRRTTRYSNIKSLPLQEDIENFLENDFIYERDNILKLLEDDYLLYHIAKLIIDDDVNKPKDMSKILNVDIKEIYNARKRLRRRLTIDKSIDNDNTEILSNKREIPISKSVFMRDFRSKVARREKNA